jgi:2-amino-4-hydroxy-6-hydroxymethyldihydropteridine diphosphokinase
MMNRGFVLVPLAEIEPDFKVPVLGPIQALIDKLDISDFPKSVWQRYNFDKAYH